MQKHHVKGTMPTYGSCPGFSFGEHLYTSPVIVIIPALYLFIRQFTTTERQRAWIVSIFSSTVLSVVGGIHLMEIMVKGLPMESHMWTDNGLARWTHGYFAITMFFDMLIGNIDYPNNFFVITGWVHHILYTWLLYYTLNSCVGTTGVASMYLVEVPTFVMALGTVFPKLRSDMGFGITFIIFRLIYHTWFAYYAWSSLDTPFYGTQKFPVFLFGSLALGLHIHWFYAWIVGQRKRNKQQELTQNAKHYN